MFAQVYMPFLKKIKHVFENVYFVLKIVWWAFYKCSTCIWINVPRVFGKCSTCI